jgi:cyclopropane fatty-acyl-phospholipid synthase-like methyltransferase
VWWRDYEKRRNDDFITLMTWITQLDAKLNKIIDRLDEDDDESA